MLGSKNMPKHVAFAMSSHSISSGRGIDAADLYKRIFSKIFWIIGTQINMNIPIMTVYVMTSEMKNSEDFTIIMDKLTELFDNLRNNKMIYDNKMKVSVLGKWYDLPGRVVEPIKAIIEETKDYDMFFLNLCINYDGREEVVDACRILGRRILAGKLDSESINKESIKDNIYSSYFLPPDIMIKTGKEKKLNGFLLWDSTDSHIYFSGRPWLQFNERDFERALEDWRRK